LQFVSNLEFVVFITTTINDFVILAYEDPLPKCYCRERV